MAIDFQPSLLDALAADVGGGGETGTGDLGGVRRTTLGDGAWVDVLPGWLVGADDLFARLVTAIPWRAERRQMYDRLVDVPRLVYTYGVGEELPHPVLAHAREALSRHYHPELGEPFVTAGCCYYRDGRDSVAWHGDNLGRGRSEDTLVAIVSLGETRTLALRPARADGGTGQRSGSRLDLALGHGDLVVMGGSCQRTWQHAVPKTARPVGPRISVQFRPRNVL